MADRDVIRQAVDSDKLDDYRVAMGRELYKTTEPDSCDDWSVYSANIVARAILLAALALTKPEEDYN